MSVLPQTVLLTEAALGDDGFGGVGGLSLAALVDGSDAELVRFALGQAVNGAGLHVTGDVLPLHPVVTELLLRMGCSVTLKGALVNNIRTTV